MVFESSLVSFFDKSYVINLPERLDRRQGMMQELKRLGISELTERISFFSAVRPPDKGDFPSIGARGCFLSHLEVLKEAKKQNLNNLLIMEDDLSFSSLLLKKQNTAVRELKSLNWDLVYLGHCADLPAPGVGVFQAYTQPLRFTHFLAINKQTIPQLVDFLEELLKRPSGHPDGGPMHVDGAYSTFRQQNSSIVTLVANPSLGFQRASPSSIAGYKWFDTLPVVSQLSQTARKAKNCYKRMF